MTTLQRRVIGAALAAMTTGLLSVSLTTSAIAAPPDPGPDGAATLGTRNAFYDVVLPEPGTPVKGVIVTFNAGGWTSVGPFKVRQDSGYRGGDLTRRWRNAGFILVHSTYRSGEPGWLDVVSVYDQVRARWPSLPIGAYGQSAGAHYALLLGGVRELAFVASDAGPTNWNSWRDTYPCFTSAQPCDVAYGINNYTLATNVFGTSAAASPNVDDYRAAQFYDATNGPDAFLIYGRRYDPDDPSRTPIADGTPVGPSGTGYIVKNGGSTSDVTTWYESDHVVQSEQGTYLKDRMGSRATLRTLPRGSTPWVHANVDTALAAAAYSDLVDWTVARATAQPGPPATAPVSYQGTPPQTSPTGSFLVRQCNAAPAKSGIFAAGHWSQRVTDTNLLTVGEIGCSSTGSAGAGKPDEGLVMKARETAASGTIASGSYALADFTAPAGTTITQYTATYKGYRNAAVWNMGLSSVDAANTQTVLLSCPQAATCSDGTSGFSGTNQVFTPPANTKSLTWGLICTGAGGCPGGPANPALADGTTGQVQNDANHNQRAWLGVYSSTVRIADPDAPQITARNGELFSAGEHSGTITGTVDATDATGISKVELLVDGGVRQTVSPPCDFSRPRPCVNASAIALSLNVGTLTSGPHTIAVRVTDAANNPTSSPSVQISGDATAPGPPQGLASSPASWASSGSYAISWTNPQDPSGIVAARWRLCQSGACESTHFVSGPGITALNVPTPDQPGRYDVEVWLEDGDGNTTQANSATVPIRFDPDPPTGSLTRPPGTFTRQITYAVSDATSSVASCELEYRRSGASASSVTGTVAAATCTATLPSVVGEGTFLVRMKAQDAAANTLTTAESTVVVDETDPTVTVRPSSTRQVTADLQDATAIASCSIQYRPAGGSFTAVPAALDATAGTCAAELPSTVAPGDTVDLRVAATDSAARTTVATVTRTIQNGPPSIGPFTRTGGEVGADVADLDGNLQSCTIAVRKDSDDPVDLTASLSGGRCSAPFATDGPGSYVLTLTARDHAGLSSTATLTVTVDPPVTTPTTTTPAPEPPAPTTPTEPAPTDTPPGPTSTATVPTVTTPPPPPGGGATPDPATRPDMPIGDVVGNVNGRAVTLLTVKGGRARVTVTGAALSRYAGQTVRLLQNGKQLGSATVQADGRFTITARPAAKLPFGSSRLQASVGSRRSLAVQASVPLRIERVTLRGRRAVITGRFRGPVRNGAVVTLSVLGTDQQLRKVASPRITAAGAFSAVITAPDAARVVLQASTVHRTRSGNRVTTATARSLPVILNR